MPRRNVRQPDRDRQVYKLPPLPIVALGPPAISVTPPPAVETAVCRSCGQAKPLDAYAPGELQRTQGRSDRSPRCRKCRPRGSRTGRNSNAPGPRVCDPLPEKG